MSISIIVSITTLFLTTVISFLVLAENRKNKINISFALLGFSISLWVLSNTLADLAKNIQAAFFWSKLSIVWPLFLPILFLYMIVQLYYFDSRKKYRKVFISLFITTLLIIVLSPTRLNIESITMQQWGAGYAPGPLYYLLFAHLIVGFSIAFYLLIKVFRFSKEPEQHSQAKLMFIGALSTVALAILADILLPILGYSVSSIFAPPSVLFFIGFMAYAITKHHLFNIKVIATQLLTFIIWTFLLVRTLLAETLRDQMIDGTLLVLVVLFGILLIKSVIREVEQREKLEVLNKKLEELNRLKSEFLSFASHQVKSPMAVVKGFSQLIYDGTLGPVSDKIRETAKKITNHANKMIALVENLLDMRKIDEGKMEYNFTEVEINKLVNSVVEELRPMAQDKNLDLTFTGLAEETKIKADPQKLSQVFQNFVDNAIKYTDQGWIKVRVEEKENSVLITVSDSGRGLSQKLQPHLFEQFSRDSETAKEIQGTGLGLYIAKQIVEAHHGKIWAESEGDGKGSTFFVEIPIK